MTSEEQALLRSILIDPYDDGLRLIYADWLEEHDRGDRAEFIRAQLALHAGPLGYKTPEECPLTLRHHWREWEMIYRKAEHKHFPRMGDGDAFSDVFSPDAHPGEFWAWRYERGFVGFVRVGWGPFLRHARQLFNHFPATAIELRDLEPELVQEEVGLPQEFAWRWSRNAPDADPSFIPSILAERLTGGKLQSPGWCHSRIYPTREDALTDLSRACVALSLIHI